ncbi:ATP-binding protein [Candidatus Woesearchaeota archaeon]|nr:ATP-binding protein [Candidatus Woesearchaeota archaeon]
MIKKVAIIGAHGVGKTGLAYALAAALTSRSISVELILEIARELRRVEPEIVKLDEETTIDSQARILEYQFQREIEAEKLGRCEVIICDRSFDNYLYMERKFGSQQKYEEIIINHLKEHPYTLIVKVPVISKEIKNDGFRNTDYNFQQDIDARIELFLKRYGIPHVILPEPVMPNREEWTYIILNKIGYKLRFNGFEFQQKLI